MTERLPAPPILGDSTASRVSYAQTTLAWPQLMERAHSAASELAAEGVSEGDRVAVDADDALARLCWFLGADLLGAATLLMEPSWTVRERAAVLADAQPTTVVSGTPQSLSGNVSPAGGGHTHFYLPTTSGSSGRPKVLVRTRHSWWEGFRALQLDLDRDTVLVPGPLSASLFLFGAFHALHEGHDLHLLEGWSATEAAAASRHATVIHLVPAMWSALLSVLERRPELREGCRLRKAVCGGARVDDELRERSSRVLPHCELVEYYGSAEHSLVAIRRAGDGLRPVKGVDVEVRHRGELWVRSDQVVSATLESGTLRTFDAPEVGGWSSVGDSAAVHDDGTLSIHGRASAAIVSSGAKLVAAEEVEAVLRGADGVADVLVAATPHPRFGAVVTAVVEIDPAAPPSLRAVRAHAREALEPAKRPRRWLATSSLPRTASGKPARAFVAERLREGTLDAEALT